MTVRSVVAAGALVLAVATSAMAQSGVPGPGMQDGVVAQVDTAASVVKLQDGRMYRVERAPSWWPRDCRWRSGRSAPATT